MQARAKPHTDALRERLGIGCADRHIEVVGCKDGDFFLVVAFVDDVSDRLLNPFGGLACAQLIEHKNFSIKDRSKYSQLRCVCVRVVAVLYLFQQIAEIVKKSRDAFLDEFSERRDGKMSLPYPAAS